MPAARLTHGILAVGTQFATLRSRDRVTSAVFEVASKAAALDALGVVAARYRIGNSSPGAPSSQSENDDPHR